MNDKTFPVFITKYALTTGIYVDQVVPTYRDDVVKCGMSYFHKGEWHLTWTAALEKAEDMRQRKLESLKKSLAMMESLQFEHP